MSLTKVGLLNSTVEKIVCDCTLQGMFVPHVCATSLNSETVLNGYSCPRQIVLRITKLRGWSSLLLLIIKNKNGLEKRNQTLDKPLSETITIPPD